MPPKGLCGHTSTCYFWKRNVKREKNGKNVTRTKNKNMNLVDPEISFLKIGSKMRNVRRSLILPCWPPTHLLSIRFAIKLDLIGKH